VVQVQTTKGISTHPNLVIDLLIVNHVHSVTNAPQVANGQITLYHLANALLEHIVQMVRELIVMLVSSVMQAVQFKMNVLMDLTVQVHQQQLCKRVLLVNIVDKVVMVTVSTVVQVTSVVKESKAKACAHQVHPLLTTTVRT